MKKKKQIEKKVANNNFLNFITDTIGKDGVSLISEKENDAGCIDTGSYMFNALLSGSIYGGFPADKVTGLAGEQATGKSYFTLAVIEQFLNLNKDGVAIVFESENATWKDMVENRGIDGSRILIIEVSTIEEFRTKAVKIVKKYIENGKPYPLFLALDSLGMLSTIKETADIEEGNATRDMTRTALIKGAFRVLTLLLGKAGVPMFVTNHTYDVIGSNYPEKTMSGGCLVEGTKIRMSDGTLKEIQDIDVGDRVETLIGSCAVLNSFIFSNKELYEIELDDGNKIKCSEDHKFLLRSGGWISAKEIFSQMVSGRNINILTQEECDSICSKKINIKNGIII